MTAFCTTTMVDKHCGWIRMVSKQGLRQRQQVITHELLNFFIDHNTVTAQTSRRENVKNKNQTTTTRVQSVVCKQGDNGRQPVNICYLILITLSKKKKACDCYCHLTHHPHRQSTCVMLFGWLFAWQSLDRNSSPARQPDNTCNVIIIIVLSKELGL